MFDKTMSLVQRSMDIRASRHRVLSSNVSNIETLECISRDQLDQNWIARLSQELKFTEVEVVVAFAKTWSLSRSF